MILDTAGRLHIDEALMEELHRICEAVHPSEILLTIDAMTGQDAVNVANTFNEKLEITGVILTKLDGDTRGGAALSVRAVTGKPIKFAGTGEKLTDLEAFHPERMASRILGMGDVMTLIEKAQENIDIDPEEAGDLARRMKNADFTLDDFLSIAAGSGTTVQDVNQLIRQFEEMKKQMKMVMNQSRGKKGRFRFPPMR